MRSTIGVLLACSLFCGPVYAEDHAVGGRVGLLGIGIEYTYRMNERISIRGGLNGGSNSFNATESSIDYAFDLDFDSLSIGVDFHPLKGAFRVSGGLLKNDSSLSAESTPSLFITVGDTTYLGPAVGTLRGRFGFDSTAPFVGVGWDWLRNKKVGISFDIGLLSQGPPDVSLTADGLIANDPQFRADLAIEEAELRSSLDSFELYPFATFGVQFRF